MEILATLIWMFGKRNNVTTYSHVYIYSTNIWKYHGTMSKLMWKTNKRNHWTWPNWYHETLTIINLSAPQAISSGEKLPQHQQHRRQQQYQHQDQHQHHNNNNNKSLSHCRFRTHGIYVPCKALHFRQGERSKCCTKEECPRWTSAHPGRKWRALMMFFVLGNGGEWFFCSLFCGLRHFIHGLGVWKKKTYSYNRNILYKL